MGSIKHRIREAVRAVTRFRRDRKGTTAVEFGLVVVPFLGILLAIFETAFMFWNSEGLEAAVQDAARNILTGTAQAANISTADQFRTTYLCPATGRRILPSFIDCSQLIIDVRTATAFASADTSNDFYLNPASTQFCPGAPGTIVIVRVAYPMPVFLPIIAGFSNAGIHQVTTGLISDVPNNPGMKHLLLGTAVFQTEPYAANYTAPAGC